MTVTMNKLLFLYIVLMECEFTIVTSQIRYKRFQQILSESKNPILPLTGKKILKLNSVEICYVGVGCFDIPRHHNPLQKLPEHPESLQTEFYLYRRDKNFSSPELLNYNDDKVSLRNSNFNSEQPVKILIHGYSTRWNEVGALTGVQAYLDIYDCNVILVNWEKGARGPRYSNAAANTELVGRQLSLLLKDMIQLGLRPLDVHLIGFSLGAHVAACASQQLKDRGLLIGRITGLDPASPLFKLNHFRDKRKKLDVTDAKYVDVIHTDGSPVFIDGFGLLEPIGHVDYFPNGGRKQPGCKDIKASVVVSHFDKSLDREIACSHIRAYHYFLETLVRKATNYKNNNDCEFIAYSCPKGPRNFAEGRCYPTINNNVIMGKLGEDSTGKGPMYLVTKGTPPFCAKQIQIIVSISSQTKRTRGILMLNLIHGNHSTEFQMNCDLSDLTAVNREIRGIVALEYDSMHKNIPEVTVNLYYNRSHKPDNSNNVRHMLFVDKLIIKSMDGISWQYCSNISVPQNTMISMKLLRKGC